MDTVRAAVRAHYEAGIVDRAGWLARVLAAVDGLGGTVTAGGLAGLDQFHVGGLAATVELARRAGVGAGMVVLDAGCGLGGAARVLAEGFGCRVEGVDLSPDYVALCGLLSERAGLGDRVSARVGDLTALPFGEGEFGLVWSQHVSMNIADRGLLYRETRRVLRRGGRFAFYDPVLGDGGEAVLYPVPWAEDGGTSTLLTLGETEAALGEAGLRVVEVEDVTAAGLGWAGEQRAAGAGLTLGMVMGDRMGALVGQFMRNLREGRLRLAMGVCEAV